MGIYQKKVYLKDKKGNWNCRKCSTENVPHSLKFWAGSNKAERKSSPGEKTYLNIGTSKTGDKQVIKATTFVGSDRKEVRTLITTASKLPKRYRG